jgi:ribosomal protein eS8
MRKKRKFELARPAALTKLGAKRIHLVRVRGGHYKHRALRLDTGNFSWGTESITRKTRILGVVYNASNNELVRTNTLVKNSIIQIDGAPFRQWYEKFYGVAIGKKKGQQTKSKGKKDAPKKEQAKKESSKTKDGAKAKPAAKEAAPKDKAAPKKEAAKKEAPKKEATKAKEAAPKKEAAKKEAPKKDAAKKDGTKAKEASKKEAPKKEASKKEASKEEAPKKEAKSKDGAKKKVAAKSKPKVKEVVAEPSLKKSRSLISKIHKRNRGHILDASLEEQFTTGRLLACISSRPGQSGRCDGYILEGKELEFYSKKIQKKKTSKA